MRWSKVVCVVVALFVVLGTAGCVDDHKLLAQVHEYFPGATIYKSDPRVLWVQTQVDGISGKFAEKTLDTFLQKMESQAQQKTPPAAQNRAMATR